MKRIMVASLFLLQVSYISASESNVERCSLLQASKEVAPMLMKWTGGAVALAWVTDVTRRTYFSTSFQKGQQQKYDDKALQDRVAILEENQHKQDDRILKHDDKLLALDVQVKNVENEKNKVAEQAQGLISQLTHQQNDVVQNMATRMQNVEQGHKKLQGQIASLITEKNDGIEALTHTVQAFGSSLTKLKAEHEDVDKQLQAVVATVTEHKTLLDGEQGLVALEGKLQEKQAYLQNVVRGLSDQLKALESKQHTTKEGGHGRTNSGSSEGRSEKQKPFFVSSNNTSHVFEPAPSVDRTNKSGRGKGAYRGKGGGGNISTVNRGNSENPMEGIE